MNGVFLPMFLQGLAGVNRRLYDGGRTYAYFAGLEPSFIVQAWSAGLLAVVQLFFVANLVWSLARGRRAIANPWEATTLEWTTSSPPPHDNFPAPPVVRRGPYEYSVPGVTRDYVLQSEP